MPAPGRSQTQTQTPPETAPAEPDESGLSGFLGYHLKRVLSLVQGDLAQVLGNFDLRIVSFSALTVIVRNPAINQSQLADTLKIERSNLVQIIDDLAGRGLILRSPVAGDRRRHALMPTAEGQRLLAAAQKAVAQHEIRVFAMLADAERDELHRLLRKVRELWQG